MRALLLLRLAPLDDVEPVLDGFQAAVVLIPALSANARFLGIPDNGASAAALPAVSLGIIPMSTPDRPLWASEKFNVYDTSLMSVELLLAQVHITQPSEIALYLQAFDQLRFMAVYGAEARALIVKAIDALR